MTQEEKHLLLKDLCARLPYNPYIFLEKDNIRTLLASIEVDKYGFTEIWYEGTPYSIEDVKAYLRPMSSMTEEEKEKYRKVCELDTEILSKHPMDETPFPALYNSQDWLNEHHFDYRIDPSTGKTLIESGLAIEALEGMYKTE